MLSKNTIFLSLLLLVACSSSIDIHKYEKQPFVAPTTRVVTDISIAFLYTGGTSASESMIFEGGRTFCCHQTVFVAVLVKHPEATFLFDTGLGENIDGQFADNSCFSKMLLSYEKGRSAYSQLKEQQIVDDIKMIIPSHLHWDHASGIVDFPEAQVWIQSKELQWAKAMHPPHVLPKQIHPDAINWKYFQFKNEPYENFLQHLDVFNDGTIVLVPLEGHTPGAIGMFVNFPSGKRMFFSGDTTWAIEGVKIPAQKSGMVRCIFQPDNDEEGTRKMIVKLHWLAKKYQQLKIIPAHDGKVYKQLGYFPKWISE